MNKKNLKEYRIWKAMKSRCNSPSNKNSYYQKENIKVCDEWLNDFDKFLEDMGNMPDKNYSIERIDIHKDYCKKNCKWLLMKEQPKNRRTCKFFTHKGKTMTLKDWARYFNINYTTLYNRIYRQKIPFEKAIKKDFYNRQLEINGNTKTVSEWCEYYNLNKGNVYSRIHRGWSKHDAIMKNQDKIKNKEVKEND